jgi:GNAT superfamily N-acetyltransferase
MKLRKARETDEEKILKIYKEAKAYFKRCSIDQWQGDYPNIENIRKDREGGISYVAVEAEKVVATAAIVVGRDKTYDKIYEGSWLSEATRYGVVHRIAVLEEEKGKKIAEKMLEYAEELCYSKGAEFMRIDTHADNAAMRRLVEKMGYQKCGIIYTEENGKRIAFEKKI